MAKSSHTPKPDTVVPNILTAFRRNEDTWQWEGIVTIGPVIVQVGAEATEDEIKKWLTDTVAQIVEDHDVRSRVPDMYERATWQ